jgi:hypothetical protein
MISSHVKERTAKAEKAQHILRTIVSSYSFRNDSNTEVFLRIEMEVKF